MLASMTTNPPTPMRVTTSHRANPQVGTDPTDIDGFHTTPSGTANPADQAQPADQLWPVLNDQTPPPAPEPHAPTLGRLIPRGFTGADRDRATKTAFLILAMTFFLLGIMGIAGIIDQGSVWICLSGAFFAIGSQGPSQKDQGGRRNG